MTVNPLDAEEIVWDIACQNRLKEQYPEFAVKKMSLPQGKSDRRKIMVSGGMKNMIILLVSIKTEMGT